MKYLGPPQSGSLANLTYSRNPYGQYVRARVGRGGVPTFPLTSAVAAWQALTIDQQEAWNAWADLVIRAGSLGTQRPLSGYLRFLSAWKLGFPFGATPVDAPTQFSDCYLAAFTLTLTGPAMVQFDALSGTYTDPNTFVDFFTNWPGASTGTVAPPGRRNYWKFVGGTSGISGLTSSVTFPFFPPADRRVFGRVRIFGSDWIPRPWLREASFVVVSP